MYKKYKIENKIKRVNLLEKLSALIGKNITFGCIGTRLKGKLPISVMLIGKLKIFDNIRARLNSKLPISPPLIGKIITF